VYAYGSLTVTQLMPYLEIMTQFPGEWFRLWLIIHYIKDLHLLCIWTGRAASRPTHLPRGRLARSVADVVSIEKRLRDKGAALCVRPVRAGNHAGSPA
jgi:hypothetical protein